MPFIPAIIILLFSIIIHEVSHGYAAVLMGDPTPRLQGRLTLNPLKHIDPVGSILVPLITALFGFAFGWAKPVVYNPYNIKNKRLGEFLIAGAGPASNLALAFIFGLIIRSIEITGANAPFIAILTYVVIINVVLAVFNLIPLPPLDGSKLIFAFLPHQYGKFRHILERYSPIFVVIAVFFIWDFITPVLPRLVSAITGF
jgi:Zn-dependent protease